MSMPLPPGTILQLMYLKRRLERLTPGRFMEIGPGSGDITELLLRLGWTGTSLDLEPSTVEHLNARFPNDISAGALAVRCTNFIEEEASDSVDLVISCMVMEHLDDQDQSLFWERAAACLREGGLMICLVPASRAHWGIEDEIAGHFRRYDRSQIHDLAEINSYTVSHEACLTYPLSNFLLPLSNFLVRRSEFKKLKLTMDERTRLSGIREVKMKTRFPNIFGIILNRVTLYPFYVLQTLHLRNEKALVLYFEARPTKASKSMV
jgi:SAM-dependent methyltransferase